PDPAAADLAKGKAAYEDACSQCHELADVDAVAPQTVAGWREIVERMITDEDAEIDQQTAEVIIAYLATTKGPAGSAPAAPTAPSPGSRAAPQDDDGAHDDDHDDD